MATGPNREAVKSFFDTGAYLGRNAIVPIRARIVAGFLGDLRASRVLDLGCGDGSISRPLLRSGNRLTLVDFSPRMLDGARAATAPEAPVEFVEANLLQFEPIGLYDAVICVGVLAHVPSIEQVVSRTVNWLRPGGRCVLQITDDAAPLGWLLNRYYRARNRNQYDLNTVAAAELLEIAWRHELVPGPSRRYGLLLPGLGRVPYRYELAIEKAAAARSKVARWCAELLVCFRKMG